MLLNEEQGELFMKLLWEEYKSEKAKVEKLRSLNENTANTGNDIFQALQEREQELKAVCYNRNQLKEENDRLQGDIDKCHEQLKALEIALKEEHKRTVGDMGTKEPTIVEEQIKQLAESNRVLNEQIKERSRELTNTKIALARTKEKLEYAEGSGFKFPSASSISKKLKELRGEASQDGQKKQEVQAPTPMKPEGVEVPYVISNGVATTKCERGGMNNIGKAFSVGGSGCQTKCPFYNGRDIKRNVVYCTKIFTNQ